MHKNRARVFVLGSFAESLINFRGELLHEIVRRGYQVIASASDITDEIKNKLSIIGVQYHNIPVARTSLNPFLDMNTLFRLILFLKKIKPDILKSIHSHAPNAQGQ
jgi:hypothetical protein